MKNFPHKRPTGKRLYALVVLAMLLAMAVPTITYAGLAEGPNAPSSSSSEVEITGTLEEIGDGYIVVDGQTIAVGAGAEVKGSLTVGDVVKVHARVDLSGDMVAHEIESTDDTFDDDGNANDVIGNANDDDYGNANDDDHSNANDDGYGNANDDYNGNANDDDDDSNANDNDNANDDDHSNANDDDSNANDDDHSNANDNGNANDDDNGNANDDDHSNANDDDHSNANDSHGGGDHHDKGKDKDKDDD